jgi:hypothetical protein
MTRPRPQGISAKLAAAKNYRAAERRFAKALAAATKAKAELDELERVINGDAVVSFSVAEDK